MAFTPSNRENFDVEMGKKSFSLCGNLLFTLFYFPSTLRKSTSSSQSSPATLSRWREKQIEKRDCFEIHGASQVPTVPFGFPFIPPPNRLMFLCYLLKRLHFFLPFSSSQNSGLSFSFNSIFMRIFTWREEGAGSRGAGTKTNSFWGVSIVRA